MWSKGLSSGPQTCEAYVLSLESQLWALATAFYLFICYKQQSSFFLVKQQSYQHALPSDQRQNQRIDSLFSVINFLLSFLFLCNHILFILYI